MYYYSINSIKIKCIISCYVFFPQISQNISIWEYSINKIVSLSLKEEQNKKPKIGKMFSLLLLLSCFRFNFLIACIFVNYVEARWSKQYLIYYNAFKYLKINFFWQQIFWWWWWLWSYWEINFLINLPNMKMALIIIRFFNFRNLFDDLCLFDLKNEPKHIHPF